MVKPTSRGRALSKNCIVYKRSLNYVIIKSRTKRRNTKNEKKKKADNGEHYLACSVSGGHGNMTNTSGAILPVFDLRSPVENDLQL